MVFDAWVGFVDDRKVMRAILAQVTSSLDADNADVIVPLTVIYAATYIG